MKKFYLAAFLFLFVSGVVFADETTVAPTVETTVAPTVATTVAPTVETTVATTVSPAVPTTVAATTSTTAPETVTTATATTTPGTTTTAATATTRLICPHTPSKPLCPPGNYLKETFDINGCIISYDCAIAAETTVPTIAPQTPTTAPAGPDCSATKDGTCPQWCAPGSDYDCCAFSGKQWIEGRGCYSSTETTYAQCPSQPSAPPCSPPNYLKQRYDKGCIIGYDCVSSDRPTCPPQPSTPACSAGNRLEMRTDNNGCVTGYECIPSGGHTDGSGQNQGDKCPPGRDPVCGTDKNTYYNACDAYRANVAIAYKGECGREQKPYCGDNRCDIGEDQSSCSNDCGRSVPQGCRVEKTPEGFERFFCEGETRPVCRDIKYDMDKCYSADGNPIKDTDPAGCTIVKCEFGQQQTDNYIFGAKQCSNDEEVRQIEKKCSEIGLPVQFVFVGEGCKQARCGQVEERGCKQMTGEERKGVEESCFAKGLQPVKDFDTKGCPILRCGDVASCERDVPKQAYTQCNSEGGELIVDRDDRGCVSFVDCIRRGDENDVYVDRIEKVPETTELLAIAFKLEELRVALDKLAKQTNDIANYYKSTGSDEEERFKRVADMFESARDKVTEIKDKLRERLNEITEDDILEVKHDVKYIKDVMLKDIVYFMLSTGDEIKELKASAKSEKTGNKDCGSNGACFDRGIRACQSVTFSPEGKEGPVMEVRGLEGDECVVYALLDEEFGPPAGFVPGINPPYDMTCRIKDYAKGIRGGPEEFLQFCTGSLVELAKQFGTEGPKQAPSQSRQTSSRSSGSASSRSAQPTEEFGSENGVCDCTWPVSQDHPNGCPVFCSRYPDEEACEVHAKDGCAWSSGKFNQGGFQEPRQIQQPQASSRYPQQQVSQQFQQPQQNIRQPGFQQPSGFNQPSGSSGGGSGGFARP